MKSVVTYGNSTYLEVNTEKPVMVNKVCDCGNMLYIPLGVVVLGLTKNCGHCQAVYGYPKERHCQAITDGWKTLTSEGDIVL